MKPTTSKPPEQTFEPHARPPQYRSEELLRDTRHAEIVHRGQRYILRETRSGKLILYK